MKRAERGVIFNEPWLTPLDLKPRSHDREREKERPPKAGSHPLIFQILKNTLRPNDYNLSS